MRYGTILGPPAVWVALALLVAACSDPPLITGNGGSVKFTRTTSLRMETDKVDVLVVLDDTASVASLQAALKDVPALLRALATPACQDDGRPTGERARPDADRGLECEHGLAPFRPIVDIHVGAISATRGSHVCGFLAWLPDVERNLPRPLPRGATIHLELDALEGSLERLARGAGDGCGLMTPTAALKGELVRRDSLLAVLLVTDSPERSSVALAPYLALRKPAVDLFLPRIVSAGGVATGRGSGEAWIKDITNRLQTCGVSGCFVPVRRTPDLRAPCVVLQTLPREEDSCEAHDLRPGPPDVVEALLAHRRRAGERPSASPVCLMEQLTTPPGTTCARDPRRGWCFVENSPTSKVIGACGQALVFSPKGTPLNRAYVDVMCAESREGGT